MPDIAGDSASVPRLRFDFIDGAGRAAPVEFTRPAWTIEAWRLDEVRRAMAAVERAAADGWYVAGFVAYEAAPAFDTALATHAPGDLPLVWFGVFRAPSTPGTSSPPGDDAPEADDDDVGAPEWRADVSHDAYRVAIDRVRAAIAEGDSYQANYTFRLRTRLDIGHLRALYRRLAAEQRAPYAAHLELGRWQVLSLSPELFFRIENGHITTRPMKGTAARGLFADDDRQKADALRHSEKNRAENVMIVDLARNDVGRVAEIGSVHVPALFTIERYPAVFQMVSTVQGRLRPDATLTDVFAALFPAGSITGAPKTSSMRLIAGIERSPRGLYCGAIGIVAPGGRATFSVAIRTAVVDASTGETEYGVGGGITWDSTAGDEHAEALSKASFLIPAPAFELFETMRFEAGRCVRLDRHLDRMADSAAYFDFVFDRGRLDDALGAHAAAHGDEPRRVRLRLARTGEVHVDSDVLPPRPAGPATIVLALTPVSSEDRFLFHKTTRRQVFDAHRRAQPDAFDVLLWNERGELTEFTIGNLVVEIGGKRWTPPRACGLLAGVFRGELIASSAAGERVLMRKDLASATRVWLVNSLREWVEVRI